MYATNLMIFYFLPLLLAIFHVKNCWHLPRSGGWKKSTKSINVEGRRKINKSVPASIREMSVPKYLQISIRRPLQKRFYPILEPIDDDSKAIALFAIAFQRHQIRTPLLVLTAAFNTPSQLCKAHTNKHVRLTLVAEF